MWIKWIIGKGLEIIITLIFGCNWIWNVVQNVKNLFSIEGVISSVEVNGSGYTLTFYFLMSPPSELKTSLSTKNEKVQSLELRSYLRSVWIRIFKSKAFYSYSLGHELFFVDMIRDIWGRKGRDGDCNSVLSCIKGKTWFAF